MPTFWHWWILAVVLLGLELTAPGIIFLWVGIAAAIVGVVILFASQMAWEIQVLLFSALSLAVTAGGRIWWKRRGAIEGDPTLNRRGASMVGTICVLETNLTNGRGRARVGDSTWTVTGPDLPKGTPVRIVAVEGSILSVEVRD
ncbi:MAG: NfeD family protein [Rhodospirillum sp.]|nr:NfeD family protein [Rhodospirillum sp.]MCF8491506.1 NfeD family protein [Rhodospirillum sp.]